MNLAEELSQELLSTQHQLAALPPSPPGEPALGLAPDAWKRMGFEWCPDLGGSWSRYCNNRWFFLDVSTGLLSIKIYRENRAHVFPIGKYQRICKLLNTRFDVEVFFTATKTAPDDALANAQERWRHEISDFNEYDFRNQP